MTVCEARTVQIPNGDLLINAYLVEPSTRQKCPAVIVIQEIFGVNGHIRDVTRRVAELGYVAIAPNIYQRIAPGFEAGYGPEDIKLGREYKMQTKASELLSDLQATIDYLYQLPQVQQLGVGTVGFCFGGHVVYLAATLPEVRATASFYGAGIANWCPGEAAASTIERTKDIQGELFAFFGTEDASVPPEQVVQIKAELERQKISHQVFEYDGAGHGFFCDRRGSYHKEAAEDAWEKVKVLFQTQLNERS
ncbi:MAG: dienelactone hydrolase family protein [Limnothrix sp.]